MRIKEDFLRYLESIDYNERTVKKVVKQLGKWVSVIREPFDIIELFSKVKCSRGNLILALRKLFSFYELQGVDKDAAVKNEKYARNCAYKNLIPCF